VFSSKNFYGTAVDTFYSKITYLVLVAELEKRPIIEHALNKHPPKLKQLIYKTTSKSLVVFLSADTLNN